MLDVSASHLWQEIQEAERINEQFLGESYEDLIRSYVGPGYRDDWSWERADSENFAYQWFSLFAPQMLAANPRVKTRSRKIGSAQDVTLGMQYALNRNIQDTRFRILAEHLLYDWGFRWGVALTLSEPRKGRADLEDPIHRPVSKRIPLKQYLSDPLALEGGEDRWRGHMEIRDKEDLLEEAEANPHLGWNVEVILGLAEDVDLQKAGRRTRHEPNVHRTEVTFTEIWVPEHQLEVAFDTNGKKFKPRPEDGYHGTIFTVARQEIPKKRSEGETLGYVRRPRPFYGPQDGPYTTDGVFLVPNETRRLGPIAAMKAQVAELNAVRDVITAAITSHKRGFGISALAGQDVAEAIKNFKDLGVFQFPGAVEDVRQALMPLELSGVTQEHLTHFEFLKASLERNSGLSDALLGNAQPDVTATAESIASSSSTRRAGYMAQKFVHFLEEILRKEAWYLLKDSRVALELGPEAVGRFVDPESGAPIARPMWWGGFETDLSLEDLEIEIDLYSMSQSSEQKELMISQQMLQIGLNVAPAIPTTILWFDWERWLEREGERLGVPDLASFVNFDLARAVGGMMLQMQMQPGQAPPSGSAPSPQPRLKADLGSPRLNGFGGGGRVGSGAAPSAPNRNGKSGSGRLGATRIGGEAA